MSSVNDLVEYGVVALVGWVVLGISYEGRHYILLLMDGGIVAVEFAGDIFEYFSSMVQYLEVSEVELVIGHNSIGFFMGVRANAEVVKEVFGKLLKSK